MRGIERPVIDPAARTSFAEEVVTAVNRLMHTLTLKPADRELQTKIAEALDLVRSTIRAVERCDRKLVCALVAPPVPRLGSTTPIRVRSRLDPEGRLVATMERTDGPSPAWPTTEILAIDGVEALFDATYDDCADPDEEAYAVLREDLAAFLVQAFGEVAARLARVTAIEVVERLEWDAGAGHLVLTPAIAKAA